MGTNVVRLVRSDHRRICELLARLEGRHRSGTALSTRVTKELEAHVAACRDRLLPFAQSRVNLDRVVAESLDELMSVADGLGIDAEPSPAPYAGELVRVMSQHVEVEERCILQPLQDAVAVDRLRRLGESFRRTRDSVLRSAGVSRGRTQPTASRAELYERARFREIAGRSAMSKAELEAALNKQPRRSLPVQTNEMEGGIPR